MAYTKQTWENLPSQTTPINADRLSHIEQGIYDAASTADTAASNASSALSGLDDKVDKIIGKGLSTNDFTDALKTKLDNVEAGAEVNVQSDWNQSDNSADDYIKNKPSLGTSAYKNSTSVVTDSTDLVESGAVKDIIGWGNKNLLENTHGTDTIRTVVFTENADGSVTVNGTADGNNALYSIGDIHLKANTTYILSGCPEGGGTTSYRLYIGSHSSDWTDTGNGCTFTVGNTDEDTYVAIYARYNVAISNKTFYPMIRLATITDDTYEPYHKTVEEMTVNKADNSVIAPVENGTTASQAYAVGSHFIRDGAFCTVTTAITSGESLVGSSKFTSGDVADSLLRLLPIFNNAGSHNGIFRGKNLGSSVTTAQKTAIANGSFEDLYIGDYWEINSVKYRIAHFDYWLNCGDGSNLCTEHHVVVVPDSALVNKRMNAKVNNVDTTAGAYVNSEMRTTNLADAKTIVNAAFGADNILGHREYMQNAVTDGYESAGAWVNADIELMSEIMVYGSNIFHNVKCGTALPNLYTVNKTQLALFRLDPSYIICKNVAQTDRSYWWLRDVVSATQFAIVDNTSVAYIGGASSNFGVRPAFGIK